MKHRKPRPPRQPSPGLPARIANIPATYDEAVVASILVEWRKRHAHVFEPEASHAAFEAFFLRQLQSEEPAASSIDAIYITDLARRGHPAADVALRKCIILANRAGRFTELPLAVRAYNDELLMRAPVVKYASQAPEIIDTYIRDHAIGMLVDVVRVRFPHLPVKYGSGPGHPRSVVDLVGGAFGLSEKTANRIYRKHKDIPRRVAEFFLTYTKTGQTEFSVCPVT
jgi:hypothetical protein